MLVKEAFLVVVVGSQPVRIKVTVSVQVLTPFAFQHVRFTRMGDGGPDSLIGEGDSKEVGVPDIRFGEGVLPVEQSPNRPALYSLIDKPISARIGTAVRRLEDYVRTLAINILRETKEELDIVTFGISRDGSVETIGGTEYDMMNQTFRLKPFEER